MAGPFDSFKPFSFSGIDFPYVTYSVTGGIRKHKHEYPHSPGAAVEKLGRELYEIHVTADFTAGLPFFAYKDLLLDLSNLRNAFEEQITDSLHIPHIGTIVACADKWTESARNTNRSTIRAEFSFFEDLNSALQLRDTVTVSTAAMPALLDQFNIARDGVVPDPIPNSFTLQPIGPNSKNVFDAIADLTVLICGIKDQQELYGALVSSKLAGLIALCKAADQSVSQLNKPQNYLLLDSLHAIWASALELQSDLQNTGFAAEIYVTKKRMGIADVSFEIYGNTLAAAQLMQLNEIQNPLAIPANTQLIYYRALQSQAA